MTNNVEKYEVILSQVKSLIADETDLVANMANISAVLFNSMVSVNWAGFYFVRDKQLVLGPFQGEPACIRIPMGRGVCGTAAQSLETQIVKDVHQFEGHIACDANSRSEIVIPVIKDGHVLAVLDIDSPDLDTFGVIDAKWLTKVVNILVDTLE